METGIFYFSGTGNSLAAAKALRRRFDGAELINIADIIQNESVDISKYGRVIAVYPSYAYGTPVAVRRFFQRAAFGGGAYIAALVTYGSRQGGALAEVKRLLRRRGIKLDYAGRIPAVENFIPIFGSPKAKTLEERTAMQERAVALAGDEIEAGAYRTVMAFRVFPKLVSVVFRLARPLLTLFYRVGDSCTGCGVCAKICPARAITMEDNKPSFSGKCEVCQACLNWCPQRSISFLRFKPRTARYTNASVKLAEFTRRPKTAQEIAAANEGVETCEDFAGETANA